MFDKSSIKNYGLGLGLRRSLQKETLEYIRNGIEPNLIEWLEIVPENYINRGGIFQRNFQEFLDQNIQFIPHSVNLSIGTAPSQPGKAEYDPYLIDTLKDFFQVIKAPWFSDHISCTRINGFYLQDLLPIPFTREAVEVISTNIKFLQDEFQIPFLIENPSYYTTLIEPEMGEVDFINAILAKADCGLLLDVNNVYVNSINHNYSPEKFISGLDIDRTVQIHIAGHREGYTAHFNNKYLKVLDTHGENIKKEVFDLLRLVLSKTETKAILLERDSNFPEFPELLEELQEIRNIMMETLCQV